MKLDPVGEGALLFLSLTFGIGFLLVVFAKILGL